PTAALVTAAAKDPDDLSDVRCVGAVRAVFEVASQQPDRLGEAAHAAEQQSSVARVLGIGRLDHLEKLDDCQARRPVALRQMNASEVPQHARKDLSTPDRAKHS